MYFQVTRGVAKRDHAFPKNVEPTVFLMSNPLVNPAREDVEKGGVALSAADNRWLRCDIKSTSLIGTCLLRQLSAEAGGAETILFRDGRLTEASSSNVFVVKNGVLAVPPESNLILPGITYDVVVGARARRRHGARAARGDAGRGARRGRGLGHLLVQGCLSHRRAGRRQDRRRQARSALPSHVRAVPGVQAQCDARGQARARIWLCVGAQVPSPDGGSPARVSCEFPSR